MITRDHVMPIILKACPSFRETWDTSDDQDLLYAAMGDPACHLFALHQDKRTDEFESLCEVIEELHLDGDDYVRELATIGFLESIQNVWGSNGADPEQFAMRLLPESRKWWEELDRFWAGKVPYVGAGFLSGEPND